MVAAEDALSPDPWQPQGDDVDSSINPKESAGLLNSPIFPMLLLACFAFLILKVAGQLLCLSITAIIFIYRRLRRLSQRSESAIANPGTVAQAADNATASTSATQDSKPALAIT